MYRKTQVFTPSRLPLERFERGLDSLAGEIRLRFEKAPGLGLPRSQKDPDVQITVEFFSHVLYIQGWHRVIL
jgi:hypothetical protein